MATPVIKAFKTNEIDISKITLGSLKKNKIVPVVYGDKPFIFQTPFLKCKGSVTQAPNFKNIYQIFPKVCLCLIMKDLS